MFNGRTRVSLAFIVTIVDFKHEVGPVYSDNSLDDEESISKQLSQMLVWELCPSNEPPADIKARVLVRTIRINSEDLIMRRNEHLLFGGFSVFLCTISRCSKDKHAR